MLNKTKPVANVHTHSRKLLDCATLAIATLAMPALNAAPAQQAYLKASNPGTFDQFGYAVAISGDTAVVGAWQEGSSATGVNGDQNNNGARASGAAYVFVRSGRNWVQQAYLKASNTGGERAGEIFGGDFFGWSVAISGDTIVVGAHGEDSAATGVNGEQTDNNAANSGAAYVFVRSGTNWTQQAYLKASNSGANDQFGYTVAVSGDTAVVGANGEGSNATGVNGDQNDNSSPGAGAAYVFVRDGTNWTQQAYLKGLNAAVTRNFGFSVGASGDTLVVGAPSERSNATGVNADPSTNGAVNSGAAFVFVRSGTNWSQQAYLKASNAEGGDSFGWSAAVDGDTVVVGARWEDSNATGVNGDPLNNGAGFAGAAYVFARSGTNWSQQAYLKASNTEYNDEFGLSVSVSGDIVVVGAPSEDSNATGTNGEPLDNGASDAGAAYVFVRDGTNWSQQAYLKASNTGVGDAFGFSVSVSGATIMAGAYLEDSDASGVNGDQSSNYSGQSGAAYVFTGLGVGPRLELAPDGSGGYFIRFSGAPDVTYQLLRTSPLPGSWDVLATLIAPASGLMEFHDTMPLSGQAFFRAVRP